jgi:hypothetical protein
MSYNNEIIYNYTKKYNYAKNETDQQVFIFELILTTITNEELTFRSIKKNNQGSIDIDDIQFDTINKFNLTVLNINSFNKPIILKKIIDHNLNSNTYMTNKIYLEINKINKLIEFNYNIIN